MAILKMVPPVHGGEGGRGAYRRLKRLIDYVLDPAKTKGGFYTGSSNCLCGTSFEEICQTQLQYGKVPKNEHDRVAYHFIISWKPEENVNPETALEIAAKFCEEYLPDYEAVFGVHLDKKHMHVHIAFNSISYKSGRKYRYEKGDWAKTLQPLVDRLCKEYQLHTLETDTGISLDEYESERKKRNQNFKRRNSSGENAVHHGNYTYQNEKTEEYSYSDYIREDIDRLIMKCHNFQEFDREIRQCGYWVKYGKSEKYGEYMAVKSSRMKRFRRTYALGTDYTVEMIKNRITAFHSPIPEISLEEEKEALLTGPVYRCRFHYGTDNVYLRRQYARMYRLGVAGKHVKRPSYWETVKKIRELRRLEYQMEVLAENGYQKPEEIDAGISAQEEAVAAVRAQIKQQKAQGKPYKKMLENYLRMEELEGAFLLYQEGDEAFQKEADEYRTLKLQAEQLPCNRKELEEYLEKQKEKIDRLKGEKKEEGKKLEALKNLRREYEQVTREYEPADDEMLKEMEEHALAEPSEKKQRRKEL